jgi:hypothetical protein
MIVADWDAKTNAYNNNIANSVPDHPATIAQLKSALTAYNSTSYTPARMFTMTYNDLTYAARLHGLTVNTTL